MEKKKKPRQPKSPRNQAIANQKKEARKRHKVKHHPTHWSLGRIIRNTFWYSVIMLGGIAYSYWFNLERVWWTILFPLYALFLFWMVSRLRQLWRF